MKKGNKVALIGNMNNNFFGLCRHLRDAGIDAHLFLLQESSHFLPQCDAIDSEYKSYTYQTDWHSYYFFDPCLGNIIREDLKDYEYIIGCDWAPAYIKKIGRKLDVFVPYGGDLLYYTNKKSDLSFLKKIYRLLSLKFPVDPKWKLGQTQIDGIKESTLMLSENTEHLDPVINQYFKNVSREKITVPMVYDIFKNITQDTIDEFTNEGPIRDFEERLNRYKHLFLSQMRHCWKNFGMEYSKGNDIVIKAFAKFCKLHNDTALVLFEYGVDVDESKKLIEELGIGANVIWLPIIDRKFILYILKRVDLCIGEINKSFLTYGVVLEAVVMKVPLVHNYELAATTSTYDYLYDCFHASNEEELLSVMNQVYNRDFDKEEMVNQSYEWYHDQLVNKLIYYVTKIIHEKDIKAVV